MPIWLCVCHMVELFHGERITAGVLCNPNAVKQLVRTEQAYKFLKNVCGSPAYWQNELYDVLAMLHSLGIPTWFCNIISCRFTLA